MDSGEQSEVPKIQERERQEVKTVLDGIQKRLDNARLIRINTNTEDRFVSPVRKDDEIDEDKATKISGQMDIVLENLRTSAPKTTPKGDKFHEYSRPGLIARASIADDEASRRAVKGDLDVRLQFEGRAIHINGAIEGGHHHYMLGIKFPEEEEIQAVDYISRRTEVVQGMNSEDYKILSYFLEEVNAELVIGEKTF